MFPRSQEEGPDRLHRKRSDDKASPAGAEAHPAQRRGPGRRDGARQALPEGGRATCRMSGALGHGRVGRLAGPRRPCAAHRPRQVG